MSGGNGDRLERIRTLIDKEGYYDALQLLCALLGEEPEHLDARNDRPGEAEDLQSRRALAKKALAPGREG